MKNHLELNFFRIEGHYGVYQGWMKKSDYFIRRSCGLAALLNILIYEKILQVHSIDEAGFYLDQLSKPYLPRPWGIVRFSSLLAILNRVSPKKYQLVAFKKPLQLDFVVAFIQEALKKGHPLLLLTFNHKSPAFHNHWITITGLSWEDGQYQVICSNWGQRRVYSLNKYLSKASLYRGLGYFQEVSS